MDSQILSMAQQFSGLPMDALISVPLNSAASANNQMALTYTKFLLDTCFSKTKVGDKDSYEPLMIPMKLTRGYMIPPETDDKGTVTKPATMGSFDTVINLPLLTIVPLNSLAVQTVKVNFVMEVKSSFAEEKSTSDEEKTKAEVTVDAKIGFACFSANIKASASYEHTKKSEQKQHYEQSNSATYTVEVTAGQLPLPQGVNTIIAAYAGAIAPVEMPKAAGTQTP